LRALKTPAGIQKFLDDPEFSFAALAGKIYSAVRSFVRMFLVWGGLAVAGVAIGVGYKFLQNHGAVWDPVLLAESSARDFLNPHGWGFQIIVVLWSLVLFAYGRRVYLRFGDADD